VGVKGKGVGILDIVEFPLMGLIRI